MLHKRKHSESLGRQLQTISAFFFSDKEEYLYVLIFLLEKVFKTENLNLKNLTGLSLINCNFVLRYPSTDDTTG